MHCVTTVHYSSPSPQPTVSSSVVRTSNEVKRKGGGGGKASSAGKWEEVFFCLHFHSISKMRLLFLSSPPRSKETRREESRVVFLGKG